MESGQAHAPQQAEQEAETPQDKIETEEGGEAQNQQDQEKTEAVSRESLSAAMKRRRKGEAGADPEKPGNSDRPGDGKALDRPGGRQAVL